MTELGGLGPEPDGYSYADSVRKRFQAQGPVLAPGVQDPDPPPGDAYSYEDSLRTRFANEDALQMRMFKRAAESNPDLAAEAQRLGIEFGLDEQTVARNIAKVQTMARRNKAESEFRAIGNTMLRRALSEPNFARIAHDDIPALTFTGEVFSQWERGQLEVELGNLGREMIDASGSLGNEQLDRIVQIRERLKLLPPEARGGLATQLVAGSAKILGQQFEMAPLMLAGGAAGASAAFVAGQLGPQLGLPEEIITVPGGFVAGMAGGMGVAAFNMESGIAYLDMVEAGFDHHVSAKAANVVGAINASFELLGVAALGAGAGLFKKRLTAEVARRLSIPTTGAAAAQFIRGVGVGLGGEVVTEVAQEGVSTILEESARAESQAKLDAGEELVRPQALLDRPEAFLDGDLPTELSSTALRGETFDRLVDTAVQVTKGMILLSAPGPGFRLFRDTRLAQLSKEQGEAFKGIVKGAKDSKALERDPGQYEQFLQTLSRGTSAESIYIRGKDMATILSQANLTKEQFAQLVPEVKDQLDAAIELDLDVIIPTEVFGARIARVPELESVMRPHMRFDPELPSLAEAQAFEKNKQEFAQTAADIAEEKVDSDKEFVEARTTVRDTTLEQLKAAGWSDRDARVAAELQADFQTVMADRFNKQRDQFIGPRVEGDRRILPTDIRGQTIQRGAQSSDPNVVKQTVAPAVAFFSALSTEAAALNIKATKAAGWKQAVKSLVNKGQVKQDEVDWSGINDWLDLQEGKVSKEDVQAFLDANGIVVTPVVLGLDATQKARLDVLDAKLTAEGLTPAEQQEYNELVDRKSLPPNTTGTQPKFAQFTLPGGENYREVLLTLPESDPGDVTIRNVDGVWVASRERRGVAVEVDRDTNRRALRERVGADRNVGTQGRSTFQSPHFEQPNIVAHIRMDDRTDADGNRVLFIEEIQSDWAQKGRKVGFGRATEFFVVDSTGEIFTSFRNREEAEAALAKLEAEPIEQHTGFRIVERQEDTAAVRSAPFVETTKGWLNLALKQVMLEAVNGGYQKVAFINGEQSADRFDLSKQVEEIDVETHAEGRKTVGVFIAGGHRKVSLRVQADGVVSSTDDGTGLFGGVDGKPLDEVLGKEMAQKIMAVENPEGRRFQGDDLKVGGEGMRAFYDRLIPNTLKPLLKKAKGGAIETVAIKTGNAPDDVVAQFPDNEPFQKANAAQPQLGFDVTEAMTQQIQEQGGLPLFQEGDEGTAKGGFNPKTFVSTFYEKADLSTFLHESAHYYLSSMEQIAADPSAPQGLRDDFQQFLDWRGVKDAAEWQTFTLEQKRKHHEAWSLSFESYLADGKAPTEGLRRLFETFRRWLVRVYRTFRVRSKLNNIYRREFGENLPILTPEIRGVFDRLLATEDQIAEAEVVRSMEPMFETQEASGMSPEEWARYQAALVEAHESSVTELGKASMRQMAWLSRARGKVFKKLQKTHDEIRKKVRAEATARVDKVPVYRAIRFLRHGEVVRDDGTVEKLPEHRMDTDRVRRLLPEGADMRRFSGGGQFSMTAKDGVHPDDVADMLGFRNGQHLIDRIVGAPPRSEEIDSMTDGLMLERAREEGILNPNNPDDRAELDRLVDDSLHNEARARFIAVELRFLQRATQPVRLLVKAARSVARQVLSVKPLRQVNARQHSVSEGKAARDAQDAGRKGNPRDAIAAKRRQLIQNQLARESGKVQQEVRKARRLFGKMRRSDKRLAKTRVVELVHAARGLLSMYGLDDGARGLRSKLNQLRTYDPDLWNEVSPLLIEATAEAKDWRDLTVEEFMRLRDSVTALWDRSRQDKMTEVAGRKVEIELAVAEMLPALQDIEKRRGPRKSLKGDLNKLQTAGRWILKWLARHTIVAQWARRLDLKDGGPWQRFVVRPIRQAANEYRAAEVNFVQRYVNILKQVDTRQGIIDAPELGYSFGKGNGGLGKAEIIGAILHMGNASNLRKLLIGNSVNGSRGQWVPDPESPVRVDGTADDTLWRRFLDRMIAEGILTEKDMDQVQAIWDLNEEIKPLALKAMREVKGFRFKEVEAQPFTLFGKTYRGGYVPAKTDRLFVMDAEKHQNVDDLLADMRQAIPNTGIGFSEARQENYARELTMDVGIMTRHLQEVLRFTFLQPTVTNVFKLLNNPKLKAQFERTNPAWYTEMLVPWLQQSVRQSTTERGGLSDPFFNGLRKKFGLSVMFGNLRNAIQQVTGFSTSLLRVKPMQLLHGFSRWSTHFATGRMRILTDEIKEKSLMMRSHLGKQIFDLSEAVDEFRLKPGLFRKVEKWTNRHGYFMQQGFQNIVDISTWLGMYDQSIEGGVTEAEAVARADDAVIATQGRLTPEEVAVYQTATPLFKILQQFTGWANMLANLNVTEWVRTIRSDLGFAHKSAHLFQIYILGYAIPIILGDLISSVLAGRDWDDDDDFVEWLAASQLRGLYAFAPIVGPAIGRGAEAILSDSRHDDRMTEAPAIRALSSFIKALGSVAGLREGSLKKSRDIQDVGTLVQALTGAPAGLLSRPIGAVVEKGTDVSIREFVTGSVQR